MIKNPKIKTTEKVSVYIETVGRRKTSIARVRLFKDGKPEIIVNDKNFSSYFPIISWRHSVEQPLKETGLLQKIRIEAKIKGGGIHSQAEALQHGIARALDKYQPDLHKLLKHRLFLRRDSRMKERRKFGLKKARKAPQWSKR